MEINKESPFVRGIEERLDAIFESDNKQPNQAGADRRNLKEDDPLKEVTNEHDVSDMSQIAGRKDFNVDEAIDSTQSSFIRSIEERLDAIFESDNRQPDQAEADRRNLKEDDPLKEVTIERDVADVSRIAGKKDFKVDEAIELAQSSFVRGIEERLDAIFESDNRQPDQAEADRHNLKEDDPLKEVTVGPDISGVDQADGKKDFKAGEAIDSTPSQLLQGIDKRLDAIFESDKKQPDQAEADILDLKEDDPLKEVTVGPDISGVDQTDGKKDFRIDDTIELKPSQLLQGIDDRLDAIFGAEISGMHHLEEDDPLKEVAIETNVSDTYQDDGKRDFKIDETIGMTAEPSFGHERENHLISEDSNMPDHAEEAGIHNIPGPESLKKAVAETELSNERNDKVERFEQLFEELVTSTSIWYSPLKDLKSTVLSIEWELTEEIMEKFDNEINKLSKLFAEDNIVLGFLRILRFLGRYIKVKGIEAHYVSIKLLLSVYDDLERVLLTREITEAKKHAVLLGNIEKYREWVETVDLATPVEGKWVREEIPSEDVKKTIPERHKEDVIIEPVIVSNTKEITMEESIHPSKDEVSSLDSISGMTPHEAFAYALDEIKKVISAEFSALKAELKLWRQGQ